MRRNNERENYIELLDEDGWRFVKDVDRFQRSKKSNMFKVKFFGILLVSIISCLFVSTTNTYSRYISTNSSAASVKAAKWLIKLNDTTSGNINIDLSKTIVANNYSTTSVIPGTKGVITLEFDFSQTEVGVDYLINADQTKTVLPPNLKFYTDEDMKNEFNGYSGSVAVDNINNIVTKKLYWQWNYTEDDENDWMAKDLSLVLNTLVNQDV